MEKTQKNYDLTVQDREIVMTRVFQAPRELVFKVLTDAKHIPNWWGPSYLTTRVDKFDVRPGGLWRFVQQTPDGKEFGFSGVYHEVVPPEKLVSTFEFEAMPGHIIVETVRLESIGKKTRVTVTSKFDSNEDRDGMIQSGMEAGAAESWDRLSVILANNLN